MVATSALYSGLQIADKEVKLLGVDEPRQKFSIKKLDDLKTEIGHQNLLVSFDYNEEAVDKVSYHIGEETNKFYLTIKPKKGYEPLKSDTVEFSYTGAEADLVILVGVSSLEELEQLYFGYEKLYQDSAVIAINEYQTSFGTVKYDLEESTSYSELVAVLMNETELVIDQESATQLLSGIEQESKGFRSPKTSADTFEVVAKLMRLGAVRLEEKEIEATESVSKEVPINLGQGKKYRSEQAQQHRKGHNHNKNHRLSSNHNHNRSHGQDPKNQQQAPGSLNYQPTTGEGGANS